MFFHGRFHRRFDQGFLSLFGRYLVVIQDLVVISSLFRRYLVVIQDLVFISSLFRRYLVFIWSLFGQYCQKIEKTTLF